MTLGVFLYVSGADAFLFFFSLFLGSHSLLPLLHCVSPPPGFPVRFLGPGIVHGGGGGGGAPELSASASTCPSFRLQSITLSIGGSRGEEEKNPTKQQVWLPLCVSLCSVLGPGVSAAPQGGSDGAH